MEIILLEDVKTLGKKGQKVKVNDGYARNYIIPKKLGIEATAKNLNDLKLKKANEEKIAARIAQKPVVIAVKTGEGGKLFGSVSTKEIALECTKQLGLSIDKKKMQLSEPIKTLGTTIVPVKLHKDVTAELTVKVTEL